MNSILDDVDIENNHFNVIYPCLNSNECSRYYNIEQFNNTKLNKRSDFLLLSFNIRSLSSNYDLFNGFSHLLNKEFDVICFTESWLKEGNKDIYNFEGYNALHNLRTDGRRGGGISIYISSYFNVNIISECTIMETYIETLFVEVSQSNKNILIATVYKPNKSDDKLFIDKLLSLLNTCNKNKYDEIILNGDFNFDLLKYEENGSTLNFINSLSSISLIPVITKPTRITDQTATLIDNIFISNPINFSSGIIISDISDHFPTFIHFEHFFIAKNSNPNVNIEFRPINDENTANFVQSISSYDLCNTCDSDDCSTSLNELTNIIDHEYKSCFPLISKTISYKNTIKPWISKEIISLIKKRHHYYTLFRKNIVTKNEYIDYRNFVTNRIKFAKKKYFEKKFNDVKNNIKETWKIINNVLKPNSNRKKKSVQKIFLNNKTYENSKDISNLFNNYFTNIGKTVSDSVESHDFNDHKIYLHHLDQQNSFFFRPILPTEINTILKSLKNTSNNINKTPIKLLKVISNLLSVPLANIINKSLETGNFPDSLKLARVTPIHKEDQKTDINNYRPISVLPPISKIFEKVVFNQLYKYFEQNSLLIENQFGFRARKSTTHAILNLMQYLYQNLDTGNIIFSIFLDFRKAFDTVNHQILISKLESYGIRGQALDWFQSYLSNRKQYVNVNDTNSDLKQISCGVPQGSILGPLLFLIFINDLPRCSKLFKYILYADDSTLSTCIHENELNKSIELINTELKNLHHWLSSNKIALNKKKTNYMIFSYNKNIKINDIKIGSNIILETDYTKYLGIHVDHHLTFKYHINEISRKLSKSVGLLHKLNKFLPHNILKIIYSSLMHPYISYGVEAWYGTYRNHTNKISILQKKAIRAINNLEYNDHTTEYFRENRILKLEDQYKFQISNYLYKILNSDVDNEISTKIKSNVRVHSHNTRCEEMLIVSQICRSRSKNCIFHNGVKIWNSLPKSIKNSNSFYKLKKLTKTHYLEGYTNT